MTRPEFDAWVEQHYADLLAVAVRRTDCEPEDIVQAAVAGMLASPALPKIGHDGEMGAWPWAVSWVRGTLSNRRRAGRYRAEVEKEFHSRSSLGEKGNLRTPARRKCQ